MLEVTIKERDIHETKYVDILEELKKIKIDLSKMLI
jgi:hypothetical protein